MEKPYESSPKHKKPDLDWVLYVLRRTEKVFGYEPLYDLTEENVKKIKSAIEIPFVSFWGEEKYKTLAEKAAATLYLVSKNHAFGNGNKRTAVILALLLIYENDKWTTFSAKQLYDVSLKFTSDQRKNPDIVITELAKLFERHIENFKK